MCNHVPSCPSSEDSDREAARVVSAHPEQGWSLLCNGVVLFDDCGQILPSGRVIRAPHWQEQQPCPAESRPGTLPLAS